jgi:predicted phosphodiesterase
MRAGQPHPDVVPATAAPRAQAAQPPQPAAPAQPATPAQPSDAMLVRDRPVRDLLVRDLLVRDLEVVTVTDTSLVITWFTGTSAETDSHNQPAPVDADTEVLLGDPGQPRTLRTVLHDTTPTPYHYAEISGLEPGRTYAYVARSAGRPAEQTALQFPGLLGSFDRPGIVTMLTTPPGRYLGTIALAGDAHIGESVSGVIAGNWPPPCRQDPGLPPYPEVMLTGLLDDLGRPGEPADLLLLAGDLTAEATAGQASRARQLLDAWGRLGVDYLAVRGNHDRPHTGAAYASGSPVPGAPGHHDCWGDVFGRRRQQLAAHELAGLRIIGLDTTTLDAPNGTIDAGQLSELRGLLRADPHRPTLLFGHHPVTYESALTTGAGPGFNLDPASAAELESLYARTPGVFFHHCGHTHRNNRTAADGRAVPPAPADGRDRPGAEFLEVAAVKEYPGGYSLLRLYTGGYLVSFYKIRSEAARRWSQRTRQEYFGIFPHYALGTIADRNHTVAADLSGLARHLR